MTYDPVDTNDDGVVDADVDNQSVNTGDATITDQFSFQFEKPQDKLSSRSLGTTYQNTTGSLIRVWVRIDVDSNGSVELDPFVSPESNPASSRTRVWRASYTLDAGDKMPATFLVPDGQYYEVRENTGNGTLNDWTEAEARSP